MAREAILAQTMVELADTLVDDFDLVDLLTTLSHRCIDVLGIEAAGIMLAGADGGLQAMTSSSAAVRVVELFELQAEEGPCLDCYRTGRPVVQQDLDTAAARWPRFAPVAIEAGFKSAGAIPMRLRRHVVGALNLFCSTPSSFTDDDLVVAQALADIATIAILQHRTSAEAHALNTQLTKALSTRIVIEQAKGVIAERERIPVDQAFSLLRQHSRNNNRRLADVAADVVERRLRSLSPDASS